MTVINDTMKGLYSYITGDNKENENENEKIKPYDIQGHPI